MDENCNALGIKITLMSDVGKMDNLWVPVTPQGRHFFNDKKTEFKDSVYIEAKNNKWYVCCVTPALLSLNGQYGNIQELQDNILFQLEYGDIKGAIYVEYVTAEIQVMHNYMVNASLITIGRASDNDIVYDNAFVSRNHAKITFANNMWTVIDDDSTNHVYVNGRCMMESNLGIGDEIYILGLRIIIGVGFIAINSGGDRVTIKNGRLYPTELRDTPRISTSQKANVEECLFNRFPRRRLAFEPQKIEIEYPPMPMNGHNMPMLLRMGSSMVMGGSAAMMGNYTMLLTSVLFPVLNHKYTEKEKQEYETKRIELYTKYLSNIANEIKEEKEYEQRILGNNYPELTKVLSYTKDKRKLWERRKVDDDFLSLRLGYGSIPLKGEVIYQKRRFELEEDVLENKMYALAEQKVSLENAPILSSLIENYVISITGSGINSIHYIEKLLMQLTVLHSYDEVKTVFLIEPDDYAILNYIRYLPHTWDDNKDIRFIATNNSEVYQISEYLKNELGEDLVKPRKMSEILQERTYYVVFALSKKLYDSMEVLKDAIQYDKSCGISIITMFEDLPKECFQLIEVTDRRNTITYLKEIDRGTENFNADTVDKQLLQNSAQIMSNTSLKMISDSFALPNMVTFLEMFGVGRVEHLNPLKRWGENDPVKSLATPIGIATDGTLFTLNLHQKSEGPHGLIAGMTGSGKSEFILTYILSLAVNYHPDEVAFVLIDYKGGGLTGAFENPTTGLRLPHVMGSITNLDGAAIQRSLISIESELKRRQRVFNEIKNATDEGTMDIYTYQKLQRKRIAKEPMPHLFIISDEFAELKQQAPEFMDQLISIARIGRSLGVHLILATQKPTGVVNNQILSNTKFRVCLKVQDKQDSIEMLKRPEAAELKDTGRFYLQVGYNEYFALGQSAWCGALYEPQDTVVVKEDNSIAFIDNIGQIVCEKKPEVETHNTGKSQLVEIVKMLSDLAATVGIERKTLWKDPLSFNIPIESIVRDENAHSSVTELVTYFGMADDPYNQRQFSAKLDFVNANNLLIVGPGQSGKSTLMQTILIDIAKYYSPQQVNYYVLDYSNKTLLALEKLPHCGVVITEDDGDKIVQFFRLILEIIKERKELFAKLNVNNYEAANEIQKIPLILVCIDNIVGLNSSKKGQDILYSLQSYLKEGIVYGIRFIASCSHLNEAPQRVKQEFQNRIAISLKDKYEYTDALNLKSNYVPPMKCGRGMYAVDDNLYEIQIARFYSELSGRERNKKIDYLIEQISETYKQYSKAKGFITIPDDEEYAEYLEKFPKGRIPLGYSHKDGRAISIPLKQMSMLTLYFGNEQSIVPVLDNIQYASKMNDMDITVLQKEKGSVLTKSKYADRIIEADTEALYDYIKQLFDEINVRADILRDYCKNNNLDTKAPNIIKRTYEYMQQNTKSKMIIIESLAETIEKCNEAAKIMFSRMFEIAKKLNIYLVGCVYKNDSSKRDDMENAFNPEKQWLLFGGNVESQYYLKINSDLNKICSSIKEYNQFVFNYREKSYTMTMPCGKLPEELISEDDKNIFE